MRGIICGLVATFIVNAAVAAGDVKVIYDQAEIANVFPDLRQKLNATWQIVQALTGIDGVSAPEIYVSEFNRRLQRPEWNDFQKTWWEKNPSIWRDYAKYVLGLGADVVIDGDWIATHADPEEGPFPAHFRAYQYSGTNRIQISTKVFFSGVQNDHLGRKKDFTGAGYYSAGHEMLHYALEQAGYTDAEIHHCLFTLPLERREDQKSLVTALADDLVEYEIAGAAIHRSASGEAEAKPCAADRLSPAQLAAARQAAAEIGGDDGGIRLVSVFTRPLRVDDLVGDARVVYFGETHWDTAPKVYLAQKMAEFKSAGVTHLALEMFNNDAQALLDQYARGEASDAQIVEYLRVNWGHVPESYLLLVKAARAQKIQVVALDRRPQIKAGTTVSKKPPRDDLHMAAVIAKVLLASNNNRVLVLIGVDHIDSRIHQPEYLQYQPGLLLERFQIASRAYEVVPLHALGTVYRPEDPSRRSPFYPGAPGWVKDKRYYPTLIPERQILKENGGATDEVFIPARRDKDGFDGKILIDAYNRDI